VRYAATAAGALWAVANPVVVILVFWFVSAYGLRLSFEAGPPFFLVLFCGLVPWMTFHEALTGSAGAVLNHSFLVKKIAFPLEILPVVSIVASTVVHAALVTLLVVILVVSGVWPTIRALQAAYFLFAMLVLTTSLGWILAGLNVFSRDVGQALGPLMTVWFWITPIVWPAQNLSGFALYIVQLNPLYYVVAGYRNAFLYDRPLLAMWPLDLYFWVVTTILHALGAALFQRLKPHFAEVL
jgi:teichoic acid transport system permease protein